ncbi:hypothetical protein RHMOL_Rhmol06G0126600 [Rhododendron molle]|uniref:Uncharacterized protein n=1 Tax=Rhododendron molle TaxID=49168 RepID=A0ACC0NC71_RHOML|nr:hypothetical protein RHMOL_Rhmol06G0126600 [Rhododendron molle]
MDQPINLSNLLTIGRGRGRGTARGRGRSQSSAPSHGRRGPASTDAPPGFSPEEIEASHSDKHQRLEASSIEQPPPQLTAPPTPLCAPQFTHGGRPVTIRDNVESEGTALALSQHARLASENAKLQNSIVRLERERNQARGIADELRGKLEGAEDSLSQTLTELEVSKNEAKAAYQQGYNKGIRVATESYTDQMPGIQDQVFEAGWLACLKKSGTAESSPLWTEIDFPSIQVVEEQEEVVEEDNLEPNANVPE